MCSIPCTTRPRLCTIWTAVAPEAVFTRRTNEPTTARYPSTQDALSDHIQTRTRSSTTCEGHDYTVVTQVRPDLPAGAEAGHAAGRTTFTHGPEGRSEVPRSADTDVNRQMARSPDGAGRVATRS